jgi:hypothetical protein
MVRMKKKQIKVWLEYRPWGTNEPYRVTKIVGAPFIPSTGLVKGPFKVLGDYVTEAEALDLSQRNNLEVTATVIREK